MSTELDITRTSFSPGLSLVEASAGTGKTFNLALGVVRMLLAREQDASPAVSGIGAILVVTFTTAATEELVTRIRHFIQVAYRLSGREIVDESRSTVDALRSLVEPDPTWARTRLGQALSELDGLAVFTIHGFCKRVLDEFALESGTLFQVDLLQDEGPLRDGAVRDWWRRTFYQDAAFATAQVAKTPEDYAALVKRAAAWPEAVVEPAGSMAAFRTAAHEIVQRFCAAWPLSAFRTLAPTAPWKKDATQGLADEIAETDRLVVALTGCPPDDPRVVGYALPRIAQYAPSALHDAIAKNSKAGKSVAAQLVELEIATIGDRAGLLAAEQNALLQASCLQEVKAAIASIKQQRQTLGFNDLLTQLAGAIRVQGPDGLLATAVRRRYAAALIDEFQDTDDQQFGIFTAIFKGRPLVLIGDPKQAIYAFRGADVHAYLRATREVPEAQRFTLTKNWRSRPEVVDAVNRLFERRTHPLSDRGIIYPRATAAGSPPSAVELPGGHGLEWIWLDPGGDARTGESGWFSKGAARDLALDQCVAQILDLLRTGWKPGQIAILVREGHEGVAVEQRLRAHHVPAIVSGMGSVLASDELTEVHLLLEAIAFPRRSGLVRAALGTSLWGFQAAQLQALHAGQDDATWASVLEQFAALRDGWQRQGVLHVLQAVMTSRRVAERWLPLSDGDRRLTNLRHVTELIHGAEQAQHLGIDGVLRCVAAWRAGTATHDEQAAEITQLRLETDADAVQIITVHRSKGLQYDLVFCPTLWNGRPVIEPPFFVDSEDGRVFDLGSPAAASRARVANAARLAEDLRLLYVALTRARFRTYVTWAPVVAGGGKKREQLLENDGAIHSALGYLLGDDPSLDACRYEDAPEKAAETLLDTRPSWRDTLHAMVESSGGTMAVIDAFVVDRLLPYAPDPQPLVPLAARILPTEPASSVRFRSFAIGSFTSLVRSKATADREEFVRDRDEEGSEASSLGEGTVDGSGEGGDGGHGLTSIDTLPLTDFRRFPAGRAAGNVLHTLFEQSRFDDSTEQLRPRVTRQLLAARMATSEQDPQIDAVVAMMARVLRTPWSLPGTGDTVRLCDVPQTSARHEWHFLIPCADAAHPLTTSRLVECFRTADDPVAQRYVPHLQALPSSRLDGFLQGFVDLVFAWNDRWHVVDWKSNRLPLSPASYTADALEGEMHRHHYTLQAYLYVLALHRFLRTRVAKYDYDRHVGGFAYAYLRGFVPEASVTGHGWFTHRPSRALVDALDAAIGGMAGVTGGQS